MSTVATSGGPAAPAGVAGEAAPLAAVPRTHHRLRDLDTRGRLVASLFAVALLIAPLLAFADAVPDWTPANDPALMALRALDVGTDRTPLTGQPSTSGHYVGGEHVDHPGALHFYLMAIPVRLLGVAPGMLSVSLAIVATSLLVTAWAVFRQLGARAGVIMAVGLAAVTFTTGQASLVNPVSSNMAGYPLLCATVLCWCLACGDVRLLPLTAAVVSFAVQQHLSVVAAIGIVSVAGVIGLALALRRRPGRRPAVADAARSGPVPGRGEDGAEPPRTRRWVAAATGVSLVLWAPILYQQATGSPGNLTMMARFATADGRPTLGPRYAVYQVAHTLGLPPLLGRTDLTGGQLVETVDTVTWVTAGLVVALLVGAAISWRRSHPRRATLVVFLGAVVLAGLANGASVPVGLEAYRLAFYHWVFPLAVLTALALALALTDALGRLAGTHRRLVGQGAMAAALAAIVVVAVVNPGLDRRSNTMAAAYSPIDRPVIDALADEVVAARDGLADRPLLIVREAGTAAAYTGFGEALSVALEERGMRVSQPSHNRTYVHDDRLGSRDDVQDGLVLVATDGTGEPDDVPGTPIAQVDIIEGFDREAYDRLVADVTDDVIGPRAAALFDRLPDGVADRALHGEITTAERDRLLFELDAEGLRQFAEANRLSELAESPRTGLLWASNLELIEAHPEVAPALDQDLVARLRASLPAGHEPSDLFSLSVHRLDRGELLELARPTEL